MLDSLEFAEEIFRLQFCLQQEYAVQVTRLIRVADRIGVVKRRNSDDLTQAADAQKASQDNAARLVRIREMSRELFGRAKDDPSG